MKISEYLKDAKGLPSSKRLMSYQLLWFFIVFNIIVWAILLVLTYNNPETNLDSNWLFGVLAFDFLVLLAVFIPTQLSKIQEIKEIIALAKPGGNG